MEITFDEIMVGEQGRAHDVLASSLPDAIARSLAHHLDLPGQLPPGFELENYVAGFPHGGRYVVARTSLDRSAARQGMVFSHSLVADLGAIGELIDIAAVFERLEEARPEAPFTSQTTVKTSESNTRTRPSPELCDMLATSSDHPVVIGDPLALEVVVSALWPRLLPGMRRELRFRLSFGPEESDIAKVHIVAVPRVTVTRWPVAGELLITPSKRAFWRNGSASLISRIAAIHSDRDARWRPGRPSLPLHRSWRGDREPFGWDRACSWNRTEVRNRRVPSCSAVGRGSIGR